MFLALLFHGGDGVATCGRCDSTSEQAANSQQLCVSRSKRERALQSRVANILTAHEKTHVADLKAVLGMGNGLIPLGSENDLTLVFVRRPSWIIAINSEASTVTIQQSHMRLQEAGVLPVDTLEGCMCELDSR